MKKVTISLIAVVLLAALLLSGCAKEFKQAESTATEATEVSPDKLPDGGKYVAEFTVSHAFSSDMVLQRDKVIQVYGFSNNKGKYVYGNLDGEERYAKVENGYFILKFSPRKASSDPITLEVGIKGGEMNTYDGIMIGDVWIVSGQSNAEYMFGNEYRGCAAMTMYYDQMTAIINEKDNIRLYRQRGDDMTPNGIPTYMGEHDDVLSEEYVWTKTNEETVNDFSAVGYTFVKHLADNSDIPQGIIMAAWGGCKIQDFMDPTAAKQFTEKASAAAMPETQAIYKYMLAPFKHMTLQGILFYQGESDSQWSDEYRGMLTAMVQGWRDSFDSTFYFLNVQLSSHGVESCETAFPQLPQVRAEQLMAYYEIPDSYIIPSLDVGYNYRTEDYHSKDNMWGTDEELAEDPAHYFNKWTTGFRAAEHILANMYKEKDFDPAYVDCPIPTKVDFSGDKVIIDFANVGDGLKTVDGGEDVLGFFIVSEDGIKARTTAKIIDKDTIEVTVGDGMIYDGVAYALEHGALADTANVCNSNGVAMPTFRFFK